MSSGVTVPKAVQSDLDKVLAQHEAVQHGNPSTEAPAESPAPPAPPAPDAPDAPDAPVVQPAPEASPAQADQPDTVDWKHKFDVLRGKYDAEVPRLHMELRERDERLKQAAEAAEQAATAPVDPDNPYGLTDEAMEYGEEFISAAEKIARKVAEDTKRAQQSEQQSEAAYFEALGQLVPEWERINTDPRFHEWLADIEPMLGTTRQDMLERAQAAGDVHRTVAMFNAFQASSSQASAPTAGPATDRAPSRPSVESQVAPVPGAPSPVAHESRSTYTMAQVEEVFTDVTRGRYTPERAAELTAEMNAAIREGRVRAA